MIHKEKKGWKEEEILEEISIMLKKLSKYKELMGSVSEMYKKITNKTLNDNDLRGIWKWMKELGHSYNITEKWKKMLAELLSIPIH